MRACHNGGWRTDPTFQTMLDPHHILRGIAIIEALLAAGADPNDAPSNVNCVAAHALQYLTQRALQ